MFLCTTRMQFWQPCWNFLAQSLKNLMVFFRNLMSTKWSSGHVECSFDKPTKIYFLTEDFSVFLEDFLPLRKEKKFDFIPSVGILIVQKRQKNLIDIPIPKYSSRNSWTTIGLSSSIKVIISSVWLMQDYENRKSHFIVPPQSWYSETAKKCSKYWHILTLKIIFFQHYLLNSSYKKVQSTVLTRSRNFRKPSVLTEHYGIAAKFLRIATL